MKNDPFSPSPENKETSGRSRLASPKPFCHFGFSDPVKLTLGPPLPAAMLRVDEPLVTEEHPLNPAAAQESFHGVSGM